MAPRRAPKPRRVREPIQVCLNAGERAALDRLIGTLDRPGAPIDLAESFDKYLLAETHGFLLRRLSVVGALALLEHQRVFGPGLVWADPDLTQAAVERWLRRFRDRAFSLTDAVSFEVMRREGIRESFTFDRYFQLAGFEILSPSTPTS